ncbi:MAG: hypothetical protein ACJAVI_005747 [Candidatus Azotimanducaceae bacterium]|jgi:hypothetical protein
MSNSPTDTWKSENRKKIVQLRYWTIAWVLTTALGSFGPKLIWGFATLISVAAVILNLLIGFGMVMAVVRHLNGMDELAKKIFLDAAAITLGATLVCGTGYEMLEDIKLISYEPEISHLFFLTAITFLISIFVSNWKYR